MNLSVKAVLFDFDGTLVKTSNFIKDYTQTFINKNHLIYDDPFKLYSDITLDKDTIDRKIKDDYWEGYKSEEKTKIELFEGSKEYIANLREQGIKTGIVTNRTKESVEIILKEKSLLELFDVIIGKKEVTNKKPNPEPVLKALEILAVQPQEAIFIGNHKEDMETGINAGVHIVFFKDNEIYITTIAEWLEQQHPLAIVSSYKALAEFNFTQCF